jgi:hypothetical protein
MSSLLLMLRRTLVLLLVLLMYDCSSLMTELTTSLAQACASARRCGSTRPRPSSGLCAREKHCGEEDKVGMDVRHASALLHEMLITGADP